MGVIGAADGVDLVAGPSSRRRQEPKQAAESGCRARWSEGREMRELEELLSKLNPLAAEFVPPSLAAHANGGGRALHPSGFAIRNGVINGGENGNVSRRRKRQMNNRTSVAQREEVIRRTVYVSEIDHQIVDCRVCGDPNSVLRFAFIEFMYEGNFLALFTCLYLSCFSFFGSPHTELVHSEGARAALSLSGTMLGYYPVRVLPSKTAIAPVNPIFLPQSEDEREMCSRTIYCTNIDKKISQSDLKLFFESICGEVFRLRLLGDYHHSTRIAFVEFVMAESAIAALNCSGVVFGSLPIRVSPSKTPVRPRARSSMH